MLMLKLYQKADDSDQYRLVGGGEYPTVDTPDAFARKIDVTKEPGFIGRELSDGDIIEVPRKDGSEFYRYDGDSFIKTEFDVESSDRSEAIECIYVAPGERARELIVGKLLKPLQDVVGGGYLECFYPFEDQVGIVCNDEGKINGMPLNRAFRDDDGKIYDIVAGPFVIVGLSEDDFCSLTEQQLESFKQDFLLPEKFVRFEGELIAYTYNPAQGLHL